MNNHCAQCNKKFTLYVDQYLVVSFFYRDSIGVKLFCDYSCLAQWVIYMRDHQDVIQT